MAMLVSGMMASNPSTLPEATTSIPQAEVVTTTQAAANGTTTATSTKSAKTAVSKNIKKGSSPLNNGLESVVREYFADIPLMAEIAKCESRYRQFEKDGSVFRGIVNDKDVGLLQINEYYHLKRAKKLGIDVHTVDGNLEYARLLYEEEGSRPWNSSSPCWMKSDVAKATLSAKVLAEK
jgi:hypothetical protein